MVQVELNKIRSMVKEKQYLEERIAELEQQIYGLKPLSTERTSKGTSDNDTLTSLIASRDKLQKTLAEKLIRINQAEQNVEEAIEILTPEERTVIRYYYLKGLSWERVAMRTRYSERRVRDFKESAIKKLQKKYNSAANCLLLPP